MLQFAGSFKANSASIQKVSSHLKLKKFVPAKSLKYLDSNNESILISFKNVSYCYPKSKEKALVNVNLNINKGREVAFVGMSGSGKSTCADLMTGLITSQTGQVFISKDYSSQNEEVKREWTERIALVPQTVYLFDSSFAENIAFGISKRSIDYDRVRKCAAIACIDDFIESQPMSYETIVGERGSNLSGGQRQRIALARALYQDSELLILDEATNALDPLTESKVINNLLRSNLLSTIVYITHRISTVRQFDRIIIFDKNTIVDSRASNAYE